MQEHHLRRCVPALFELPVGTPSTAARSRTGGCPGLPDEPPVPRFRDWRLGFATIRKGNVARATRGIRHDGCRAACAAPGERIADALRKPITSRAESRLLDVMVLSVLKY